MEKRLLELLALAFQDELSENEREELDLLLREFPEYRDMAEKLQFSREHVDELELVGTIRVEEKWQELRKKNKRSRSRKMLFSHCRCCCHVITYGRNIVPAFSFF